MPTLVQYERDYSLYIGWWANATRPETFKPPELPPKRDGILVKDLQIDFKVNKVISNQQSHSTSVIRVYNLTARQSAALQEFECGIHLLVGYKGIGEIKTLCLGNAIVVKTTQEGPDRVTEIVVAEAYGILHNTRITSTIPAGKTIEDVIRKVAANAALTIGTIEGFGVLKKVLYGYPVEGTTKQVLDEICQAYQLDYTISSGVLSVRDKKLIANPEKGKAFVFNEDTGLLGIPSFEEWGEGSTKVAGERKKKKVRVEGISLKALINPAVTPGSVIKLDRPKEQEQEVPNGFYVVREATYTGSFFGSDWTMDLRCDPVERYK